MERIPNRLFVDWMAFDKIESISTGNQIEFPLARLAAMFANVHRDREKTAVDYMPADFISGETYRPQKSPAEIYGTIRSWAILKGAQSVH